MQAVHDKVMENSALLKELWEGRRQYKQLHLTLQREREQAKALQLEYDQFRHQASHPFPTHPHSHFNSGVGACSVVFSISYLQYCSVCTVRIFSLAP